MAWFLNYGTLSSSSLTVTQQKGSLSRVPHPKREPVNSETAVIFRHSELISLRACQELGRSGSVYREQLGEAVYCEGSQQSPSVPFASNVQS